MRKACCCYKIPHSGVSWVNAHEESGINVVPGDAYALAKAIEAIARMVPHMTDTQKEP